MLSQTTAYTNKSFIEALTRNPVVIPAPVAEIQVRTAPAPVVAEIQVRTAPAPVVAERLTGTVKWFNNKAGFGFITVCGDEGYGGKDIFVHYSSIRVTNSQYKYLIQGEYVDFTLDTSKNDKHEFHAMDVSGVKGGSIMCETRRNDAYTRSQGVHSRVEEQHPVQEPEQEQGYEVQGRGRRVQGRGSQGRGSQGRGPQGRGPQGRGPQGN